MGRYKEVREKDFKGTPEDLKMWKIRSTLLRIKRPVRVLDNVMRRKHTRGTPMDSKAPPELPFDCSDAECPTCFPQFFPGLYQVSDVEALESIDGLVGGIKADLEFLRAAVRDHGDFFGCQMEEKAA